MPIENLGPEAGERFIVSSCFSLNNYQSSFSRRLDHRLLFPIVVLNKYFEINTFIL